LLYQYTAQPSSINDFSQMIKIFRTGSTGAPQRASRECVCLRYPTHATHLYGRRNLRVKIFCPGHLQNFSWRGSSAMFRVIELRICAFYLQCFHYMGSGGKSFGIISFCGPRKKRIIPPYTCAVPVWIHTK
jgi:hypothetical protein